MIITNGNATIDFDLRTGSKTRTVHGDSYNPEFPESIDIKITDWCDAACGYCHESSTIKGNHGDLNKLKEILDILPQGTELAIGGGNPLSHPNLIDFLKWCRLKNFVPNLTVNNLHVNQITKEVSDLVYAFGISIDPKDYKKYDFNNIVYHVIAGIHDTTVLDFLAGEQVLILGYKDYGRGRAFRSQRVDKLLEKWNHQLPSRIKAFKVISFDNLALEQLNIRRLFTTDEWDEHYMGDDFTSSMYIDAVKQEFAPTSRSSNRKPFGNIKEYFLK